MNVTIKDLEATLEMMMQDRSPSTEELAAIVVRKKAAYENYLANKDKSPESAQLLADEFAAIDGFPPTIQRFSMRGGSTITFAKPIAEGRSHPPTNAVESKRARRRNRHR